MRTSLALRHLGAVLAGTLLLVASSKAMPIGSSGPTDEALISEVTTHKRPVLLFAPISEDRFLVIIGGTGLDPLADARVFEEPLDNMESDSVYLKSSQPLKTRWPAVTGSYKRLFAVPDSTGDNIILMPSDASRAKPSALNLNTGTVETLSKLAVFSKNDLQNTLLSSTKMLYFFVIDGTDRSQFVWRHFDNPILVQAENIAGNKTYFICSLGKTSSGRLISVNQTTCQVPIKWRIRTGYVSDTSVVLVDKKNAVYIFDRAALTSGQPVEVVKIPAKKFWTEWQSPSNSTKPSWFRGLVQRPDFLIYTITGIIIAAFITYSSIKMEVSSCCRRRQAVDEESAGEQQRQNQVDGPQEKLPYPKSLRQYLRYKRQVRSGKIKRRTHYLKASDNYQNWDYPRNGPKSGEVVPGSWSRSYQAKMMDRSAKKRRASFSVSRGNRSVAVVPFGVIPRSKREFSMAKTASRTIKKAPAKVSRKAKIRKSLTKRPPKTSYKTAKSSQSSSLFTKAKRID